MRRALAIALLACSPSSPPAAARLPPAGCPATVDARPVQTIEARSYVVLGTFVPDQDEPVDDLEIPDLLRRHDLPNDPPRAWLIGAAGPCELSLGPVELDRSEAYVARAALLGSCRPTAPFALALLADSRPDRCRASYADLRATEHRDSGVTPSSILALDARARCEPPECVARWRWRHASRGALGLFGFALVRDDPRAFDAPDYQCGEERLSEYRGLYLRSYGRPPAEIAAVDPPFVFWVYDNAGVKALVLSNGQTYFDTIPMRPNATPDVAAQRSVPISIDFSDAPPIDAWLPIDCAT